MGVGLIILLQYTMLELPRLTLLLAGSPLSIGDVRVMGALVANFLEPLLANIRNSYWPGAKELGMLKEHEPFSLTAKGFGFLEQLTYIQSEYAVSAAPAANNPIQSVSVELNKILFQETVLVPPALKVDGAALRVTGTIVNVEPVANIVDPLLANRRNSYWPGDSEAGMVK